MPDVIYLDDLRKTYRDSRLRRYEALRGISLRVEEGEAFGFVGPNGAGKSTTIKILAGVTQASSGTARLLGQPVDRFQARLGLAYVPENPYLYDYLTPYEVVAMGVKLHKVQVPDMRRHCLEWLDRFRIAHVADKRIRQFSKGMVQRTALAHALACRPKLLILDEPLSGLDPIGRRETVDVLYEYHRGGGTLFFSSHVLHDVERLADRFGLIHKGLLKTVQTPGELLNAHGTISVLFQGEAQIPGAVRLDRDLWSVETNQAELWPLLEQLKTAQVVLKEVKPTMSLEKAFLSYTQDEAAHGAA
ncbi:ABC transporter ATP-binding protein [Chitinimonas arctica]|uniref:ABC transporter ATP-binding protein n=1 Tax=Chitinimonas arctica TaxID=2594795 RepID=A0A516SDP7_9NEIS|nr:ABC transporter ATP-binding protein [Chitinimonas arctica]QDQ26269.1 ABC transporter ATP-binding protein [Chitinimonas arctica]